MTALAHEIKCCTGFYPTDEEKQMCHQVKERSGECVCLDPGFKIGVPVPRALDLSHLSPFLLDIVWSARNWSCCCRFRIHCVQWIKTH